MWSKYYICYTTKPKDIKMIFYICMNGTQIIGNDILNLAKRKAKDLKLKYPKDKITVEWSSWYKGKKGKDNYHILNIE